MLKPPRLKPGDTIGIVSPAWGGAGGFPHRLDQGIRALNELGFNVKIAPHALNQLGFVSDTPENRAQDLNGFFADPAIQAILAAIGGTIPAICSRCWITVSLRRIPRSLWGILISRF